ncbi:hypothetical protein KCP74_03745 [Salmonella enterica subsp. enterica]|nr:hypothetical protein KCP74_03745 [Salmonella enterica subsp. enterica]
MPKVFRSGFRSGPAVFAFRYSIGQIVYRICAGKASVVGGWSGDRHLRRPDKVEPLSGRNRQTKGPVSDRPFVLFDARQFPLLAWGVPHTTIGATACFTSGSA